MQPASIQGDGPLPAITAEGGGPRGFRRPGPRRGGGPVGLPLVVLIAGAAVAVRAAPPPGSLGDRASDAAVAGLMDQVLIARVAADGALRTVGSLVAGSPQAEIDLRRALREAIEVSPHRQRPDGRVEVEARLPALRLIDVLRRVLSAHPAEAAPDSVGLPADGPETLAFSAIAGPDEVAGVPLPGWRHCHARQVALASRAAALDARRRLAERIAALPAGPRTVASLLAEAPQLAGTLAAQLEGLQGTPPVFEACGICRAAVKLSEEQLKNVVGALASQAPEPWPLYLAGVSLPPGEPDLQAEGFATAPPAARPGAFEEQMPPTAAGFSPQAPEWVGRTLTARAVGRPPPGIDDPDEARELAIRAARIEARRRLWLDVEALSLEGWGTIGALLADRREAAEALQATDRRIEVVGEPARLPGGDWAVTLGLRLQDVWMALKPLIEKHSDGAEARP